MKPSLKFSDSSSIAARPFDIVLKIASTTDHGWPAVGLTAEFCHSDGTSILATGFFNGNKQSEAHFILRAALPQSGRWDYRITSDYPALDGLTGAIDVQPDSDNRYPQLSIHRQRPNRLTLNTKDPYFALSIESDWLFALDFENEEDVPRTRHYLKQVSQYGFNQIIFNIYARNCRWLNGKILSEQYDFSSCPGFPFRGTNEAPDYSDLDYSYFDRLDRVFRELQEHRIIAHVMIYVWNKSVAWPPMQSQADDLYFDHVIKRYQAFGNVIWDISKEALVYGRCDSSYIRERIARVKRLDRFSRLITVHDFNYCQAHPETVDIISAQVWNPALFHSLRDITHDFPDKPVFCIENGAYESGPIHVFDGNYRRPEICLQRIYEAVFAGTYPTHYWQSSAWCVLLWNLDTLPDSEQPNWLVYKILADLFLEYPFEQLSPTETRSSSGYELVGEDGTILSYVPAGASHFHNSTDMKHTRSARVLCLNIFTGERLERMISIVNGWIEINNPWEPEPFVIIFEPDSRL